MLTRVMEENLGGIRVVRAFAAQPHELAKFDAVSNETLELADRRVDLRVRNTAAMTYAFFLAMGLLLWVGGQQVMAGEITVGRLAEFLAFMTILQMPVRQLGHDGQLLRPRLDVRRAAVRDSRPRARHRRPPGRQGPRSPARPCSASTTSPSPTPAPATADPRTTSASRSAPARRSGIVGPPGSGKTTIAHLIPRFYDVSAGRITIDGQDVRDVTLASLRRSVSLVQQDTFLFTASIENNIAYGDPWASAIGSPIRARWQAARLHRRAAQGLRDPGRRARRVALGRPAPAPVDRAQHPAGAADPGVRRFHRRGRRRHRAAHPRRRCAARPPGGRRSSSPTGWAR